jgi:hypothetical protein
MVRSIALDLLSAAIVLSLAALIWGLLISVVNMAKCLILSPPQQKAIAFVFWGLIYVWPLP